MQHVTTVPESESKGFGKVAMGQKQPTKLFRKHAFTLETDDFDEKQREGEKRKQLAMQARKVSQIKRRKIVIAAILSEQHFVEKRNKFEYEDRLTEAQNAMSKFMARLHQSANGAAPGASCGQQYANQSANGYGGPTVEEVD